LWLAELIYNLISRQFLFVFCPKPVTIQYLRPGNELNAQILLFLLQLVELEKDLLALSAGNTNEIDEVLVNYKKKVCNSYLYNSKNCNCIDKLIADNLFHRLTSFSISRSLHLYLSLCVFTEHLKIINWSLQKIRKFWGNVFISMRIVVRLINMLLLKPTSQLSHTRHAQAGTHTHTHTHTYR